MKVFTHHKTGSIGYGVGGNGTAPVVPPRLLNKGMNGGEQGIELGAILNCARMFAGKERQSSS